MTKVLVAMHTDLVPPENAHRLRASDREDYKTEFDVVTTLRKIGHEVLAVGIFDELAPLRQAVADFKPDILFNLLEEFSGQATYDQHVVSYLEMTALPYTGCNPRGLMLARDKALGKKLLIYHRLQVPDFAVMPIGRKAKRPRRLEFPLIVKSLVEEASLGISQASLVQNDEQLEERVRLIHERLRTDAICERFIAGREVYVSVLGNRRLQVLADLGAHVRQTARRRAAHRHAPSEVESRLPKAPRRSQRRGREFSAGREGKTGERFQAHLSHLEFDRIRAARFSRE